MQADVPCRVCAGVSFSRSWNGAAPCLLLIMPRWTVLSCRRVMRNRTAALRATGPSDRFTDKLSKRYGCSSAGPRSGCQSRNVRVVPLGWCSKGAQRASADALLKESATRSTEPHCRPHRGFACGASAGPNRDRSWRDSLAGVGNDGTSQPRGLCVASPSCSSVGPHSPCKRCSRCCIANGLNGGRRRRSAAHVPFCRGSATTT